MTRKAAVVHAERELLRQCHRGLATAELQSQLIGKLRQLMSVDAVFFATADPQTLLFTGAVVEEPLGAATSLFMANEFSGHDVNRFSALATSSAHVATLDVSTRSDRGASVRSRDIMTPMGLGDELRAALVADGQCWGYLCLHRADSPLGFSPSEVASIARVGPHIASGLRHAQLLHQHAADQRTTRPGVVLLAKDLTVVAISAEAEELLSLIGDHHRRALPLPLAVYTVATALNAIHSATTDMAQLPSTRVHASTGDWIQLHASRLASATGDDQIAVVVELIHARATLPLMLSAYRLSPREAQVTQLVLRGASTRVIVDTLHISPNTVQDHLKTVFAKTGVNSRRELVAHISAHTAAETTEQKSR